MIQTLISGSTGFIGQHLVHKLEKLEQEIFTIPREVSFKSFFLTLKIKPDYIYHLRAYGNKYSQQDEQQMINVNIMTLSNLLDASKDISYQAFINFSSSSTLLPYETFYSATKGVGERIVKAFVNKYNKPVVTIRPYSVYGPGDDPAHFIPTAIKAFKENLPLEVAPGFHDWIYVDDLISGIIIAAKMAKELKGQCINIGTGQSYSNWAIISILQDIFQKAGNIKRIGRIRAYDNNDWVANNEILRKLGWQPKIDLEKGLLKLVYDTK